MPDDARKPRRPMPPEMGDKTVQVDLTDNERTMLVYGLKDWSGPAHGTDALAIAMGFESLEDLCEDGDRIAEALLAGQALTVRDWTRALVGAEFAFASDLLGTGSEWTVIQGGTNAQWIDVLRRLQRKVPKGRRFLEGPANEPSSPDLAQGGE